MPNQSRTTFRRNSLWLGLLFFSLPEAAVSRVEFCHRTNVNREAFLATRFSVSLTSNDVQ